MSIHDRWHLKRPPAGAARCGKHKKVPSAEHGTGMQWQVRGLDGEKNRVKRNFASEEEAIDFDAELRTQVRAGAWVDDRKGEVTFHDYAEMYRANRVHDPNTAARILSALRNHVYESPERGQRGQTVKGGRSIGQYPLRVLALRASLLQTWIKSMSGILHPNTVNLICIDVGAVFQGAVDDRLIARNPLLARSIQRPDEVNREAVAWTAGQVRAVAALLPPELEVLPYLAAACGHRQGELAALAVSDLNLMRAARAMCRIDTQVKWVAGVRYFAPLKNHDRVQSRDVPISAHVVPLLARHLDLFPARDVTLPWMDGHGRVKGTVTRPLVFHHLGTAWYKGTFQRPWTAAVRAAGMGQAPYENGMHVLRHTAATQWLSHGLNIARVAAYLGDTKETVLHTYSHVLPNDEARARAIMDAFFGEEDEADDAASGRQEALRLPRRASRRALWLVRGSRLHYRTKISGPQVARSGGSQMAPTLPLCPRQTPGVPRQLPALNGPLVSL